MPVMNGLRNNTERSDTVESCVRASQVLFLCSSSQRQLWVGISRRSGRIERHRDERIMRPMAGRLVMKLHFIGVDLAKYLEACMSCFILAGKVSSQELLEHWGRWSICVLQITDPYKNNTKYHMHSNGNQT